MRSSARSPSPRTLLVTISAAGEPDLAPEPPGRHADVSLPVVERSEEASPALGFENLLHDPAARRATAGEGRRRFGRPRRRRRCARGRWRRGAGRRADRALPTTEAARPSCGRPIRPPPESRRSRVPSRLLPSSGRGGSMGRGRRGRPVGALFWLWVRWSMAFGRGIGSRRGDPVAGHEACARRSSRASSVSRSRSCRSAPSARSLASGSGQPDHDRLPLKAFGSRRQHPPRRRSGAHQSRPVGVALLCVCSLAGIAGIAGRAAEGWSRRSADWEVRSRIGGGVGLALWPRPCRSAVRVASSLFICRS